MNSSNSIIRQNPNMKGSAGIYPDYHNEYEIEDPQVVNRLTNNLVYLFNIQDGDYLTYVLGHGDCHSNKQALQSWVYDQLKLSEQSSDDVLGYLAGQLKEALMMEVCQ